VTSGRVTVVAALGVTQTVAWASSYYMPAILGAPIARALHLPTSVFFGLFSGALLLSAVVGPSVGRLIDRHGGRHLLAASNLVIAVGLLILATAHNIVGLVIAWTILGIGIGLNLGIEFPVHQGAGRRADAEQSGIELEFVSFLRLVDLDVLLHAADDRGFQMIEGDRLVGNLTQRNDRILVVIAVDRQRGAGADFTRTLGGEQHQLKSVRDFNNAIFDGDARHFSPLFR